MTTSILKVILFLSCLCFCQRALGQDQNTTSQCGVTPEFAMKENILNPIFSTRDRFKTGLLMYKQGANGTIELLEQKPSWISAGRLGSFVVDRRGNIYLIPAPSVNTLDNPPATQNTIFRVDAKSGVMSAFMKIDVESQPSQQNPFGLLGIAFDCSNGQLFVSTVSGSSREHEHGKIVRISTIEKKVLSEFRNLDVLSLAIATIDGRNRLLYGSARRAEVGELTLGENGEFLGRAKSGFQFDPFNVVRARKLSIRGLDLSIETTEFNYNLVAQTEYDAFSYSYRYNLNSKNWVKVE